MVKLRRAVADDAKAILETRLAATVETALFSENATAEYAPIVISQDEITHLVKRISQDNDLFFVACNDAGEISGFGSISLRRANIESLYINPRFWRMGLGRRIYQQLEKLALEAEITELSVDASIRAITFYRSIGFARSEVINACQSNPWYSMACVRMKKTIKLAISVAA
jgi:ribosomal protein S18 acetylase RimI-like enzyme